MHLNLIMQEVILKVIYYKLFSICMHLRFSYDTLFETVSHIMAEQMLLRSVCSVDEKRYSFSGVATSHINFGLPSQLKSSLNSTALRTAKTLRSFGLSECNRVNNTPL